MSHSVYGYGPDFKSLLLVDEGMWVINGSWQIEKKNEIFYCVAPHDTFPIDIRLLGYIDYDGSYNSTLRRFENGEGMHLSAEAKPAVEVVESELCKRKYYGIECSCSKCVNR